MAARRVFIKMVGLSVDELAELKKVLESDEFQMKFKPSERPRRFLHCCVGNEIVNLTTHPFAKLRGVRWDEREDGFVVTIDLTPEIRVSYDAGGDVTVRASHGLLDQVFGAANFFTDGEETVIKPER